MLQTTHPWWYYIYYNQIFARTNNTYIDEINLLSGLMGDIENHSVVEIGSGVGGHAAVISRLKPINLTLVDKDLVAFHILSRRFSSNNTIRVIQGDGFTNKPSWGSKDRVICMYSLVQQTSSYSEMLERINILSNITSRNGVVAFEMIDSKVSQKVYPSINETTIYKENDEYMKIKSVYGNDFTKICFKGKLQGAKCNYNVKLVSVGLKNLLSDLKNNIFTDCFIHPLEENKRRVILIGQ